MAELEWRNWAGNQRAAATAVAQPRDVAEVVHTVTAAAAAGTTVKPIGSGHSFTAAAVASGVRLELTHLRGIVAVDPAAKTVRVRAGTPLHELNRALPAHGLAMPNLGDIEQQTISGALATGTHGTGKAYGCLSTFVTSLELVTGTGDVLECNDTQHPELFKAALVGVGAIGVITELTLRCVDAFILHAVDTPTPLERTLAELPESIERNDHFEFYWMPYTGMSMTKANNRVPADDKPRTRLRAWLDDDFLENAAFGAVTRTARRVPAWTPALLRGLSKGFSARSYTERSDLVFTSPRRVRFVEMEYGLPRAAFGEAFAGLRRIIDTLPIKISFPVEARFTAGDDIWLSTGHGRDNAYIAIHQFAGMPFEPYFKAFEALCTSLGGRPHWGKLHYRDATSLRPAYPRFDDFLAAREITDPHRVFASDYTRQVFGA